MTALPSIVAGLFIFATWVLILGQQRSGLAAALAISIMMLPIIIRSADVVLRLVPGNLREASAALGAPQWRTVWHVVLPTARPGLATSVILGVARGIGETAPVLLVSGITGAMNVEPAREPDDVAAARDVRVRPLATADPDRPRLRHRPGADGARAGAVHDRPHPRRPARGPPLEASAARRPQQVVRRTWSGSKPPITSATSAGDARRRRLSTTSFRLEFPS